jgi:hypothetical protein
LRWGSQELFVQAGLEPWSSLSQPQKSLWLQAWATARSLGWNSTHIYCFKHNWTSS